MSSKKSGTTAVCALIRDDTIYIAWLGDSTATLVREGVTVKVMDSHKPDRPDERARVEALGGTVIHWGAWRVNGQLAVRQLVLWCPNDCLKKRLAELLEMGTTSPW